MTDRSLETVTILGATGSIGRQTLDVLARNPERYRVLGLTAGHRWRELAEHCLTWRPRFAALADEQAAEALRNHLREAGSHTQVLAGHAGVAEVAALQEADTVVAAIVGAAGVRPTLAAVEAGKKILLANKETLVVTGALFMEAVKRHGATLLPVDSEHNAIFQCLPAEGVGPGVRRLLLTASGGPFRGWTREQLTAVTPEQAVCHPNWDMGPKISVDSATLMNKGLEYIEACWLFDVAPERIDVVIHPQSVVHSMVEYLDGSVLAQMGTPDMRTPIACALSWPERIESGASSLDFATLSGLDFQAPDNDAFPCLGLARQAMEEGGAATAVLNAANEEAVAAFLDRRLGFNAIGAVVEETLQRTPSSRCADVDAVMDVDARARDLARSLIREWAC
ncbi:MAG TPA: 1-deoxy-D-xylulose-5-phosphate reductoisomerase [Alcanivorax sp.]|jgi:1-deoxy-D-xylulose-5-phosphate reductoisomerase|nr:1-deoxy-D-xylulose-5-phosphate reductoisomerase [Alcanivorax sp.]HAI35175.1 1-deoxy-D-xylulose-5-phosphate reductoisomerase [Alcanivorax sp.]HAI89074.1 1-deoxy-D-xylulose-5-phosphate reductoisomerase [Alcanivorax sp.]HBP91247.1 1-deoxy-D-xylulose-5-phosphate reductoisomerase [Alcanivorax sp.]HCD75587.1 1-deoxy-D-xylulose-5-phosphate reductoisomerase [Alcanivorax sp.]|tara:strand:+ start:481 stop:1665 length:1185 start_codon:yes stop_codon:yes gene_type:complete